MTRSSSSFPSRSSPPTRTGSGAPRRGMTPRSCSRLYANAVSVPGPTLQRIGDAAAQASAYVVIGVTEIDGGTLYNTLLYVGPDGRLVQRHRKLMPTGGERTVWGMGDGSELRCVDTPFGVVGGLLCWENYMPLARAAIYAQHCDIYLAPTWDNSDTWVATLRHIAKEGGQFVIGVAPLLRGSDVPEELRGTLYGLDDDWMSRGHTTIVAPGGEVLAGPVLEREEIVYADLDVSAVQEQHRRVRPGRPLRTARRLHAACRHPRPESGRLRRTELRRNELTGGPDRLGRHPPPLSGARSGPGSSPCPTPRRSPGRISPARRHWRRPPRCLGAGSSHRRAGQRWWRST